MAAKILGMQQTLGNQAVQQRASTCSAFPSACPTGGACHTCPVRVQAKLAIGQPGDVYEQEADRVAEQVMRMPEHKSQVGSTDSGSTQPTAAPPMVYEVLRSPGQPLDTATRAFMEPRFGHDFSQVRVHTDAQAAESARAVNAVAYTIGSDVVFGAGRYAPGTSAGQRLLAHELTHVVQQSASHTGVQHQSVGEANHPSEQEAERMATLVATGGKAPTVRSDAGSALRRVVTVPVDTAQLQITQSPTTGVEIRNLLGRWRVLPKTPQAIQFSASARVNCNPGDSAAGYEIGIVQMQTHDVNNAFYEGATPADGSVWVRRDIPAVRPPGPCQDSPWGTISQGRSGALFWNTSSPATCGGHVSLTYQDWPQDMYNAVIENSLTGQPNYLKEIHLAFDFTTALMLRRPDNSMQTLRWAGWSVGWDYTFNTSTSGEPRIQSGLAKTGTIEFAVPMPAPPELPTRYALPSKNCNTLTHEASDNPASLQPSRTR